MSEAVVMNAILAFRVLLVGGFLLALPRITRKGLLFGVYVGEALTDGEAARRLRGGWDRGSVLLMVLSLAVGLVINLAGRPVAGNLTGTAVLLLGVPVLYVRFHSRARVLAPPEVARQAQVAVAPLIDNQPAGTGLAKLALAVCIPLSLATLAYALMSYRSMIDTSFVAIVLMPSVNLATSPFLALMGLLTATAKRSLRGGSGGGSVEAQTAFRATMANVFSWTALLTCAFSTLFSVQVVRLALSESRSFGVEILWLGVLVVAILLGNLIRVARGYGQGGALRETGTAEAPLTSSLADNAHWIWGVLYVNRDDPSIMVEERFGLGYTLNLGNRTAVLILAAFVALALGLVALGLLGPSIFGG